MGHTRAAERKSCGAFRPEVHSGRVAQMRHLSCACQRTARPVFEPKLCARSDRGQDPVDERWSATDAVRRTHASVAAAADALRMSPEAVVDAIAERTALPSGVKLAWCTFDDPKLGRWMPVTRVDVWGAGGMRVRRYPPANRRPARLPACRAVFPVRLTCSSAAF